MQQSKIIKLQCKICIKEFRYLGNHIRVHNITSQQYKEKFNVKKLSIPWNKDKNHPKYQEYINKVSQIKSEEVCEKIKKKKLEQWQDQNSKYNSKEHQNFLKRERIISDETRKNISGTMTGKNSYKKNLSFEQIFGIERAREIKNNISNTLIDGYISGRLSREPARERRAVQKFQKISKLEKYFEQELIKWKILYKPQISLLNKKTIVDFFIEPKFCIYIDGDYWHNYPNGTERDKWITEQLIKEGYFVFRFWERTIRKNVNSVVSLMNETINSNNHDNIWRPWEHISSNGW